MGPIASSFCLPLMALLAVPAACAIARRARLEGPESLALAAGLALGWCMAGGMVLGAVGLLRAPAVWLWLAAGVAASLRAGQQARFALGAWVASWRGWHPALLLSLPIGVLLALGSVPAWQRDSLVYHLALPRYFARHGGFAWPDDNIFAAFPLGWESALALLHALGPGPDYFPPFESGLAGAWVLAAAALATIALARAAGATRLLASTAGVLLALLPSAVEFGASAYVENALLLLATLALWWTLRAGAGDLPWWGSAVFAGLACWVKYPALALVVCLAIGAPLLEALRSDDARFAGWLRRAAQWSALCGAIGSPFFVRNALWRGNPFFPVAYSWMGGTGWSDWRAWAYDATLANYGHGRAPLDYLLLPWRLFTERSLESGFEGSLGPVVVLGLPIGAWLLLRAPREQRRTLALLLGWAVWISLFWAMTVQQVRFYLVATPALLALLAIGAARLAPAAGAARAAALALLAAQVAWSTGPVTDLWQRQHTSEWIAGRLTRDELLARMLPESFPPMRELESLVPESGRVWLVWMRGYTYYLRREYRLDSVFEAWRLEELLDASARPENFADGLRSAGVSHLLINRRFFLRDGNADLRDGRTALLQQRFSEALRAGVIAEVKSWGPVTLYAVAGTD
jgi:hypothetical protein